MSGMTGSISFELNGSPVTVAAPPGERLSRVLRDRLGQIGTKVGCDAGDCGACTVLMNGRQVCACLVPAAQAGGSTVTTVEGLAGDARLRRLQEAFRRHGAAQCGICTPGMLMAAADLLSRVEVPCEAEVQDALGGVLCRCTGYRKIVEAVLDAGGSQVSAPAAPAALVSNTAPNAAPNAAAMGARLERRDAGEKVAGTALFGADAAPADALWLRIIRSPHPHARFTLGDLDGLALDHPGILRILTHKDVPGVNGYGIYPDIKDQPVFAPGYVRYRGESVLGLVGSREAVEAIDPATLPIGWEVLPVLGSPEAALEAGAAQLHGNRPGNILTEGRLACRREGPEPALTVEGDWETSFVEHAYIEPEAGWARRVRGDNGAGDGIEVTATTQTPFMDLDEVALVLGLEKDRVRICPTTCGGGFGGKLDQSVQPALAVAAWVLERPVRMIYSRPESMAASTKRHPARISASASCDSGGRLVSYKMHGDFDTGAYASWGPTVAGRVPVHASGPYYVPEVKATTRAILTNNTPAGAFRGFGVPQAALAHEGLLDDLAEKLSMDPLEIRLVNALRPGQATSSGQVLEASVGMAPCLEALQPRWTALRRAAEAFNAKQEAAGSPRRRGVGVGCMWYGCGNTALSNPSTMRIGLARDGRLTLYNGAMEIGQGSGTIMLQIAADALGLPADAFGQVMGDTSRTADAGKTSASRQTFVSGRAAQLAGEDLRRKLLRLANAGPDATLALEDGRLVVDEAGRLQVLDLGTLAIDEAELPDWARIEGDILVGEGTFDPPTTPLDADGQGAPYATYAFAAQLAEVEVDVELGTIAPRLIVAAHDVGAAVNPTLVEGQIHGGIAQGLGLALMEEFLPGRTENLHDYLIPTVGDIPPIEVHLIEAPEPLGPYGAKGIGEPALVPTAPALLSAVRHATGARIRKVPALPHRVLAAIKEARGAGT